MSQGGLYNEGAGAAPPGTTGATACYPACSLNPRGEFATEEQWEAYANAYEVVGNVILATDAAISLGRWVVARAAAEATAAALTPRSVGAMARGVRVLQTGGNTIRGGTANGLNDYFGLRLHAREWGRALEALKTTLTLPPKHHGSILSNGNYLDDTGRVLGNIVGYLP